jgi:XisH protein
MPALDRDHAIVRRALVKDGWTVTDDPLTLKLGKRTVHVDLGAQRNIIGAIRGTEKIAVEIKTFAGPSDMTDLYEALGQYLIYQTFLHESEPDRKVFLAVPKAAWYGFFQEPIGKLVLEEQIPYAFAFDIDTEEIVAWRR